MTKPNKRSKDEPNSSTEPGKDVTEDGNCEDVEEKRKTMSTGLKKKYCLKSKQSLIR